MLRLEETALITARRRLLGLPVARLARPPQGTPVRAALQVPVGCPAMRHPSDDHSQLIGPPQRFLDEAWTAHPQRAELDQRGQERNPDGGRTWMPAYTHADDGWVEYWQLPWPWAAPISACQSGSGPGHASAKSTP